MWLWECRTGIDPETVAEWLTYFEHHEKLGPQPVTAASVAEFVRRMLQPGNYFDVMAIWGISRAFGRSVKMFSLGDHRLFVEEYLLPGVAADKANPLPLLHLGGIHFRALVPLVGTCRRQLCAMPCCVVFVSYHCVRHCSYSGTYSM